MVTSNLRGRCPGCKAVVVVPAEWVGRAVRCPACGAALKPAARAIASPPDKEQPVHLEVTPLASREDDEFKFFDERDNPSTPDEELFGVVPALTALHSGRPPRRRRTSRWVIAACAAVIIAVA